MTRLLTVAAAAVAGVASAALVAGSGGSATGTLSRLTATDSLPYATGCRFPDGSRGACPAANPACSTDVATAAGPAPGCDIDSQPRLQTVAIVGCRFNTGLDAGADQFYAAGCEPFVDVAVTGTIPAPTTVKTTTTTTAAPPLYPQTGFHPAPPRLRRQYVAAVTWPKPAVGGLVTRWHVYWDGKLVASPLFTIRVYQRTVTCGSQHTVTVAGWNATSGEGQPATIAVTETC